MPELIPLPFIRLGRSEYIYGFAFAPDVFWVSYAADWEKESGTGVDGTHITPLGETSAHALVQPADTFITGSPGSGSLSGRAFTITAGAATAIDTWTVPEYKPKHGIYFQSGLPSATFDFIDTTAQTTVQLHHNLIILRRGIDPTMVQTTTIELANGDTSNYRIQLDINKGVWLDYYDPQVKAWLPRVASCKEITNLNNYLRGHDNEIRISVVPDTSRQIMLIRIGEGYWMQHAPPSPPPPAPANARTSLPTKERYRIYGTAGWCQFACLPLQYSNPLTITKSPKVIPPEVNVNNAQLLFNASGRDHPEVSASLSNVFVDDKGAASFTATVSTTDTTIPPTASEVMFYIPAEWGYWGNIGSPPISIVPVIGVMEEEVLDESKRLVRRTAVVAMDNMDQSLSGSYGDFAIDYVGSNGNITGQRMRGMMAGGMRFSGEAGNRIVEATLYDNSYKLRVPLMQELNFDGWSIPDAVHAVLSAGQISPLFRKNIPSFRPGRIRASDNCPFPTLPQGTGNNPAMNFRPDMACIDALLELAHDGIPDPMTGRVVPLYTGTDEYAQWFFEGYDPSVLPVSAYYTDYDTGLRGIQKIYILNDVSEIRTSLDFQGQDPFTGELLYMHTPLDSNHWILGQNYGWFERQGRWASMNYLRQISHAAAILASIPTQTVTIHVPYDPTIHVGQVLGISEAGTLGGSGYYVLIHLQANIRTDAMSECSMILTARNIDTLTPY